MSDLSNTEEEILGSLGESDDQPTIEGEATEITEEDAGTQAAPEPSASGEATSQGDGGQQKPKQAAGSQDLVDGQGNVVAKGGIERRHYENSQRFKGEAQRLTRENQGLQSQLDAIKESGNLGTQYNLTPDQLVTGAQLMRGFLDNPVETVKTLLTQAQAAGHNIDDLGNGGIDASAIKRMVDDAVKPLIAEQETRNVTQQNEQESLRIYNEFMTRYPDAKVHEGALAQLLQREQTLSPEAAYFKLRSFYLENNLDWTKPYTTILQEQQSQQGRQTPQGETLPTGGVSQEVRNVDDPEVADVSMSFDDIIKRSMADAGIE